MDNTKDISAEIMIGKMSETCGSGSMDVIHTMNNYDETPPN